ncbi:hypothetical protein [Amycolatopsis plumensis]|uniref:hypothetical protein n=1 Tax=Amycolatopsis plumensis TaxID=236508 RepID=UPI0036192AE1
MPAAATTPGTAERRRSFRRGRPLERRTCLGPGRRYVLCQHLTRTENRVLTGEASRYNYRP